MNSAREDIPELVRRLYRVVADLECRFPGRKFTPDGHLVGSIGEVVAAHDYGLHLLDASAETHDAEKDGRKIQIKATQGDTVALYAKPEHLLVIRLHRDGSTTEVFNGPGELAWVHAGKVQKNGQRPISLSKLRRLMLSVGPADRLKKER